MKFTILFFLALLFICGCNRSSPPTENSPKYEAGTLEMLSDANLQALGDTHYQLIINPGPNQIETNVTSLDQAANILGQYGWELVNVETLKDSKIYHLKREGRPDGKFFFWSAK